MPESEYESHDLKTSEGEMDSKTLKIEVGGTYLTRDGNVVKIVDAHRNFFEGDTGRYWHANGRYWLSQEHPSDLVAVAPFRPTYEQLHSALEAARKERDELKKIADAAKALANRWHREPSNDPKKFLRDESRALYYAIFPKFTAPPKPELTLWRDDDDHVFWGRRFGIGVIDCDRTGYWDVADLKQLDPETGKPLEQKQ